MRQTGPARRRRRGQDRPGRGPRLARRLRPVAVRHRPRELLRGQGQGRRRSRPAGAGPPAPGRRSRTARPGRPRPRPDRRRARGPRRAHRARPARGHRRRGRHRGLDTAGPPDAGPGGGGHPRLSGAGCRRGAPRRPLDRRGDQIVPADRRGCRSREGGRRRPAGRRVRPGPGEHRRETGLRRGRAHRAARLPEGLLQPADRRARRRPPGARRDPAPAGEADAGRGAGRGPARGAQLRPGAARRGADRGGLGRLRRLRPRVPGRLRTGLPLPGAGPRRRRGDRPRPLRTGELGALTTVEEALAAAAGGGCPDDPTAAALHQAARLRAEALEAAACPS